MRCNDNTGADLRQADCLLFAAYRVYLTAMSTTMSANHSLLHRSSLIAHRSAQRLPCPHWCGGMQLGKGKWKKILDEAGDVFKSRSQVDLKDKWRNLERQGIVQAPAKSTPGSGMPQGIACFVRLPGSMHVGCLKCFASV